MSYVMSYELAAAVAFSLFHGEVEDLHVVEGH